MASSERSERPAAPCRQAEQWPKANDQPGRAVTNLKTGADSMYTGFAEIYDKLMTDVPYTAWADFIKNTLGERNLILELACGTGEMTKRLIEKYDIIATDASADMLACAAEKLSGTLLLHQPMEELDLYGTVDAAICTCDGMNYILEGLEDVFKRVNIFLNPGGVFIFDMLTEYKYLNVLGSNVFTDEAEGVDYVWENSFDGTFNTYTIEFRKHGHPPFIETHTQRAYPTTDVLHMLLAAGFDAVSLRHGYSTEPIKPETERAVFIAWKT
jgi:SAM-dependent methyltransferase